MFSFFSNWSKQYFLHLPISFIFFFLSSSTRPMLLFRLLKGPKPLGFTTPLRASPFFSLHYLIIWLLNASTGKFLIIIFFYRRGKTEKEKRGNYFFNYDCDCDTMHDIDVPRWADYIEILHACIWYKISMIYKSFNFNKYSGLFFPSTCVLGIMSSQNGIKFARRVHDM